MSVSPSAVMFTEVPGAAPDQLTPPSVDRRYSSWSISASASLPPVAEMVMDAPVCQATEPPLTVGGAGRCGRC